MNYLFISTNDAVPWGGSEELWSGAALRLAAKGNAVVASVWDHVPEPASLARLRKGGVVVHKRFQRPIRRNRMRQAWLTLLMGAPEMWDANELEALDQVVPDLVVFSVGYQWDPKFMRISKELRHRRIPYGVVVQLVIEGLALTDDQCDEYRAAYAGASQVWFVSLQNQWIAARELGHEFTNASVVDNPVDLSVAPVPYPAITNGFQLAMVGSLSPYHKGQDLVIELMARPKWRDRAIGVSFFGDGRSKRTLQRTIQRYKLDSIVFKGFEADKSTIWRDHHAALFASRMEGRSLALQEAMAHGRLVISTDVGGARDLVEEGRTGFLAPAPTVDLLDEALERAWQQRDHWEIMGRQARAHIDRCVQSDPVERFASAIERVSHAAFTSTEGGRVEGEGRTTLG